METTLEVAPSIPSPWRTMWLSPRKTIRRIVDGDIQPSWWPVIALVCVAQAIGSLQFEPGGAVWVAASTMPVILGPLQTIFGVLIGPFILAFVGGWFGGTADPDDIRPAIAWSYVPSAVTGACWIPVVLAYRGALTQPGAEIPTVLVPLSLAVVGGLVWSLVLQVASLAEVHKFSVLRAIATILVPVIPLLILRLF